MWLKERLKDIFYDSTNTHLDIGRLIGYQAVVILVGSILWNMHLGKELSIAEVGTALVGLLGALQFYIYKDRQNGSK